MPPKKTPAATKKAAATSPTAAITGELDKLTVKDDAAPKAPSYSFDQKAAMMTKEYTKNNRRKVELEYLCMPLPKNHFRVTLSDDGCEASLQVATPALFGETKRLKAQMGVDAWKKNDPRVVAHGTVVQDIRKNSKPEDGMQWGKPQTVRLPAPCEGPPVKKWNLLPYGTLSGPTNVAGETGNVEHTQFIQVFSVFFNKREKWQNREKEGRQVVCAALSQDSNDSDVDYNDDDYEGMDEE